MHVCRIVSVLAIAAVVAGCQDYLQGPMMSSGPSSRRVVNLGHRMLCSTSSSILM